MLRNRAVALILGLFASPLVIALGLGTLQSSSSLNEPFSGRIELLGATAGDFDALTIKLASVEQFKRAGISLNPLLYQLKFILEENRSGKDFISITSKEPIREPFLNFLVELNWSNGRLLREYTVLLDPPLYDASRRRAQPSAAAAPAPRAASPQVAPPPSPPVSAPYSGAASYSAGNHYGPVVATDTLWSIATTIRPDESVTVQQMMLALLRENPEAFGDGNINLLRRGAVLRLPDADSLRSISAAEAFAEVRRQHQLWESYRNQLAGAPTSQPVGAPAAATASAASPAPTTSAADSRLELIAPGGTDSGGSPGRGAAGGSDLLREEIDARAQQNDELSGKLLEAEEIIDLLQRQVNIKDEELAALQARLAELGIEHGDAGMVEDDGASGDDTDMADDEPAGDSGDAVVDVDSDSDEDMMGVDDDAADESADDAGPEPTATTEQPHPTRAFPHSLVPEHIAAMVPGGALTVLGLIAAAILALFAAVIGFLMKSRGGESESRPAVSVAKPKVVPEIDREDPTVTAPTDIPVDDSEVATEIGAAGDTQTEFDPNATVEAADEGEAAFTTTATDLQALAAAPSEDEEDPLEEINVYLAYERFDQAEELVKRVIGEYPDRHEYKLRLLEVYYSSNDRAQYESAAHDLVDAVGESDPLWDSAVAMWTEMSPDRALFAEGSVADVEPTAEAAKTFVDITGDADESAAGERTLAHAPGGDSELDFDLADGGDDDVLDLTAATEEDDVLDLTAAAEDDDGILDLTAEDDDDVLSDSTLADDVFDITEDGDEEVLDITSGGGDELLDISGGGEADDFLDISGDSGGGDLLDVTKTGDVSTVDDGDLLNVTSPGLRAEDVAPAVPAEAPSEDAADLEITDITGGDDDDQALDFDISDTVAPAFDEAAGAVDDEILDLTGGAAADEGDLLDFDIGGLDDDLEDTNSPAEQNEIDTLDLGTVPAVADAEPMLEDELDFDITMDGDDPTKGVAVVENEDEEGRLEITMSSPDKPPVDSSPPEGDEFDFALDGTTEMDPIAADDTLDMAKVETSDEAEIDLGDDTSLDDLTQQLDGALDDTALEELDIGGIEVEGDDDVDEQHIETVALEAHELPEIDFGDEKTVAMPVEDDVERQSDSDEADTKLNLAKAYIELGDTDGARSILDEVAGEGNEAQQAEAKSLLSQLPG